MFTHRLPPLYGLRYHKDLATRPVDDWAEFRQLCLQAAPHWDSKKIRDKTSNIYQKTRQMAQGKTVEYQGRQYPALYTPKNQTLIDTFQMTDDELKLMSSIISESEKQRRNTESKREKRQKEGKISREKYEANSITKNKPWEKLGMSRAKWYRLGKPEA